MTRYLCLTLLSTSLLWGAEPLTPSASSEAKLLSPSLYNIVDTLRQMERVTIRDIVEELPPRGNPYFDVKTFGAIGDGTTDDASAIDSAIAAADSVTGGTVYFPSGTYIIGSSIILTGRDFITLIGSQAILKLQNGSNLGQMFLIRSNSRHIVFDGLRFDGNYINQTDGLGRGITATHSTDIQVLNSHLYNFGRPGNQSFAFFCFDSPYCVARGNLFYNNGHSDVNIGSSIPNGTRNFTTADANTTQEYSDNCLITNNRFGLWSFNEFSTATHWDRKNAAVQSISLTDVRGCVVSNNMVFSNNRNTETDSRGRAILCVTCQQTIIANNTVYNLGNGLGTVTVTSGSDNVTGSGTDFSTAPSTDTDVNSVLLIEGDETLYRVTAVASNSQITVTPAIKRTTESGLKYKINMSGDLILVNAGEGNAITGNSVWYSHDMGFSFGNNSFSDRSFKRNTITGNVAYFSNASGFICDGNCSYNTIVGNIAMNSGQGRDKLGDTVRAGLTLTDNANNNLVVGNVFADDQTTPTQVYGIAETDDGVQIDNLYSGNTCKGNIIASLLIGGTVQSDECISLSSSPSSEGFGDSNDSSTGAGMGEIEQVGSILHSDLPASANGSMVYCSDCRTRSSPCREGTGSFAFRENQVWNCK